MLVLSRKVGEKLMIGDNVVLTVNRIAGNRVAIGIEAPQEVRIVRGELQKNTVSSSAESNQGNSPNTAIMGGASVAVASQPDA